MTSDEEARRRITEDLDSNFLVEAGAGTGKTACLTSRIVSALLSGRYRPVEVAAVTFTRKAAAELKTRIRQELELRAAHQVLEGLDMLFVGTVHAFCAQLLRQFPLEAGLSPGFRELDEAEGERWLRDCLSISWSEPQGQQLLDLLDEVAVDPQALYPTLQWMCENGEVPFPSEATPKPSSFTDWQLLRTDKSPPLQPFLTECRVHLYGQIMPFLGTVRERYRQLRVERGSLTFHDLLWRCRDLSALPVVQSSYGLLLVDEFQDTDPLQADLFFRLSQGRPGSLFLVGDPQQSIYRFRGAGMRAYQELRQRWQGDVLQLRATRRSTPSLCAWLNEVHTHSMTSLRPDCPGPPVFRLPSANCQQEAEQIAGHIVQLVESGSHTFSDFLVLTARNAELNLYRAGLERAGIPCQAPIERGPLGPRAASLLPLLRHLVDPQDKAVLVGVLRGPLFGHSDQELYLHVQQAGTLRPYPPGAGLPAIASSLEKLNQWRLGVRWLPPGAAMARLMDWSGLWDLAHAEGPLSLAQLRGLLDNLRRSGEAGLTLAQAVAGLSTHGMVDLHLSQDSNAVRILNVHKSKGLEARVVFLAAPAAGLGRSVKQVLDAQRQGYCFLEDWRRPLAHPAHWPELETAEQILTDAEHRRLLYVATTRAQETLVVGVAPGGRASRPWQDLEPFLQHCPALPIHSLVPLPPQHARVPSPRLRRSEPSWRRGKIAEGRGRLKPQLPAEVFGLDARDWGHLLHSLLEQRVARPNSDLLQWGCWFCRENLKLLKALPQALRLIEEIAASTLGNWIEQAAELLVEVPFGVMRGKQALFGTLDLVLRRGDGWGIVDYKTDRQNLQTLTAHSARQIEQYVHCWRQVCNLPLHYSGLFSIPERKLTPDLTPPGETEEE